MTSRLGRWVDDHGGRLARGCGTPDEGRQETAAAKRRCLARYALLSSSAVLYAVVGLALSEGRTEAAPNAVPATAALGGNRGAPFNALRLAQAKSASFGINAISGPPGTEIPVRISIPGDQVKPIHILFVRGLPQGFALSNAVKVDDAWAVSPQQIGNFSLLAPGDYEGRFNLQIVLVWGPERTRDIRTVPVSIGTDAASARERIEPGTTQSSAEAAVPSADPASAAANTAPQISPEEEEAMLERALGILQNGDIAAARLLFQRLADKGSARGALAMAKTYDPEVLTGMSIYGLAPDPAKAAEWYARAAEMGNEQAQERLATLSARGAR